jgi:hypothetical protein
LPRKSASARRAVLIRQREVRRGIARRGEIEKPPDAGAAGAPVTVAAITQLFCVLDAVIVCPGASVASAHDRARRSSWPSRASGRGPCM